VVIAALIGNALEWMPRVINAMRSRTVLVCIPAMRHVDLDAPRKPA
jgi:hypothetical protein